MTLKEKFEEVEIIFESQLLKLKQDEFCETADDCIKIADNYAIEFAKWCDNRYSVQIQDYKKLLETFKKEQEWK